MIYWGCTVFGCDRGFNGTMEDMPRDWSFCPTCGGELHEITSHVGEHPPAPEKLGSVA